MLRRTIARGAAISILVAATVFIPMFPAQAGGGACHGLPVTDARGSTVEAKDYCFTPTVLHIQPGQSVTWVNRDAEAHVVAGSNLAWGSSDSFLEGKTVTYRFTQDGVYPYFCTLHVGMTGAVVVGSGSGKGAAGSSITQPATLVVQPQASSANEAASKLQSRRVLVVSNKGPWVWSTVGLALFGLVAAIAALLALRRRPAVHHTA
jgi:plastocyanin